MFKESFKTEVDSIRPDLDKKLEILEKINSEAAKKSGLSKVQGKKLFVSITAAMLSVLILVLSVWWGKKPSKTYVLGDAPAGTAAVLTVNYNEIYTLFKSISDREKEENRGNIFSYFYGITEDIATEESAVDYDGADGGSLKGTASTNTTTGGALKGSASDNKNAASTGTSDSEYSETNVQVEGIDEGDTVKTDGKYIYIHRRVDRKVFITKAENGKLTAISEISYNDVASTGSKPESFVDMYVKGDRLVLITSKYLYKTKSYSNTYASIITRVFDIFTPKTPKLIKALTQSGEYVSSRLSENNLFVFTTESFSAEPDKDDPTTFVPSIGENNCEYAVAESDICAFSGEVDRSYFTATSVDILSGERIDNKTVLGGGNEVYVNSTSILAAATFTEKIEQISENKNSYSVNTSLIRFSISGGKITYTASGSVKGSILNQFSMDEYNGYIRIVTTLDERIIYSTKYGDDRDMAYSYTTEGGQSNSLYVLDQNLKVVGALENLAKDEKVYSVRFSGDIGYFVTFRQVDPLFTVDLSDPQNPKILSALKIPGFSSYLHPYGEGLLLGIGKNADENTGRVGTAKLSMFDVSNPENVTEQSVFDLAVNYIPAENSHKAVLVSTDKNIIGLAGSDYRENKYFIYTYKDKSFQKLAEFNLGNYIDDLADVRGIYIGNYLYICCNNSISSYTLDTFQAVDKLLF